MKKFLFFAGYFLFPIIPVAIYLSGLQPDFSTYTVSVCLGIYAYVFIAGQFLLAARPGFAVRTLGQKGLVSFHSTMPVVILVIAAVHKFLKEANGFAEDAFQARFGAIAWWTFAVLVVFAVLFMANTVWMRLGFLKKLKELVYKKTGLSYKIARVLHNIAVLAGIVILVHVLLASTSSFGSNPVGIVFLAALMLFCLGAYLVYRIKGRKS